MEKKTPPEISEHFKKLGQKSWEARKKAILEKKELSTSSPLTNERT